MSGDVTYQALKRLSWLPDRDASDNGSVIAGQEYDNVEFIGGNIANVVLTDVTINGVVTSPTLRIVTAAGPVIPATNDYTLVINKTVPAATSITLSGAQTTGRRLEIKDGKGDAATNPITLTGTVDGSINPTINTAYGARTIEWNGTQWNTISDAYTTGNVQGPAGSTDNAIVRFDGTTGQQIQNSAVTIADTTGVITGTQGVTFYSVSNAPFTQGQLYYDSDNESLSFFNNDSNVSLQIGQEEWIRVRNVSGSLIPNGSAVYLNGASAGLPTIALAQANAGATVIGAGLTTEAISNNSIGYVTCIGTVHGLDTSLFTAGQTVYISSTVAGGLTATAPLAPNYRYRIGIVGVVSATVGTIHVTPSTASLGNGSANQLFGMNNAGTSQEVKSLVGTASQVTVTNAANLITLSLPNPINVNTTGSSATVTTNANLTGPITSVGNATSIASQTGTGTKFVVDTGPTLITPILGVATATSINKLTITSPATGSTLTIPDGVTLTGPAASGTAMTLGNVETVTGAKTFNSTKLILAGSTSGTTTLNSGATAGSSVLTLPVATDTLVGKATTDTFTNKTYDTAGTGNSFSINGLAATANTGTGAVVRSAAPAISSIAISGTNTGTSSWAALQTFSVGVNVGNVASATSTTFDWYEEGSFTPVLIGATIAGTGTYTNQTGRYTREGNKVDYYIQLAWTAHTGTGNMQITGFPYTFGFTTYMPAYISNMLTGANSFPKLLGNAAGSTIAILQLTASTGAEALVSMDTSAEIKAGGVMFL